MKLHSALATTLRAQGVTTMFGVVGEGNMYMVDRFVDSSDARYVATANEAGAVLMASGFSSASGTVGLATVTSGPGIANTLASLISATRERASIVVIAGDTPSDARGHSQKIDQASLVAPTGAGFEGVTSAQTAGEQLVWAFRRAVFERRPIVFNVPSDLMFEDAEAARPISLSAPQDARELPDPESMDEAIGIIAGSKCPIVLGGLGAISSSASDALRALADALGAPTATTVPAKGLFARSTGDLGIFGTLSSPRAAEIIGQSDCVIAVGASLNMYTGGGAGWPFFRGKRVIQVDTDFEALGCEYPVDVKVHADATSFARVAIEWLSAAEYRRTEFRNSLRKSSDQTDPSQAQELSGEYVDLTHALYELDQVLPENRSFTLGGGRIIGSAIHHLSVLQPRSWTFPPRGFGAVGNDVATAIGVGCALPHAPSVVVVGDGGFMLGGLAEFNTAVRHQVDLIVVVCNDGSYGMEYLNLRSRDFDVRVSMFDWPDFAPVAESLGGQGICIRTDSDLDQLRRAVAMRDRPLLIDLKLDPSADQMN